MENKPKYLLPVTDIQTVLTRRAMLAEFVNTALVDGVDYGSASGSEEQKPTLLKPGAEKLIQFFGLEPHLTLQEQRIDLERDEPFIFFTYHCALTRDGILYGEGDGCACSYEMKYRYRWVPAEQVPPHLEPASLPKRDSSITEFAFAIERAETSGPYGKPAEYWAKWREAIESGKAIRTKKATKTGKTMDAWILPNVLYRVPNADVADQINTIMKMAQKRALIAATLIACGVSELFTQDLEDFGTTQPEPRKPEQDHDTQPNEPTNTKNPATPEPQSAEPEYIIPKKSRQDAAKPSVSTATEIPSASSSAQSLRCAKERILALCSQFPEREVLKSLNAYLRAYCGIQEAKMPAMHPLYHDAMWTLAMSLTENHERAALLVNQPEKFREWIGAPTGSSFSVPQWAQILAERNDTKVNQIMNLIDGLAGMTNQQMLAWMLLAYHSLPQAKTIIESGKDPLAMLAAIEAKLGTKVTLHVRSSDAAAAMHDALAE